MKKILRAVIAASLFLGTAAGMSAISTTQIMINLRPIIIIPGYEEEGNTGERRPGKKLDCTIDPQKGVQFLSGETPDFILYEIYDSGNACVGAYGDEAAFIDALFSLTGEYRISLSSVYVTYSGYVVL